ncbi:hypothetical protein JMJ35_000875 [Cladonia borealis]|uniref:Prion-inhibition and propagation HeLo domain-containing protein n=1 Tax=Cladonia borealis TaxID=184061 RepID=A0AA39R7E9_9LECA|nr:hypothetical protein JMJ35_000875 [Cladonia borealis]
MVPVEPISFSVGVATLFSTCVECFKYFKAGQAQHTDYELLELEFDLIKSRMLIWGNAIGIGNVVEGAGTTEDDTSEPMSLLARSLNAIKSLLEDYKTLQDKYGLREVPETTRSTEVVRDLPSFQPLNLFRTSRLYIRLRGRRPNATSTNLASRTVWAIIDKEKFEGLVAHLKTLVDGLERVYPIPVAARDQTFQSSVATIELSKLRIVDTACEAVYPELDWASIARTVKDASDLGTIDHRNVAEWRTDTSPIPTTSSPSLEFKDPFGYLAVTVSLVLTAPCRSVSGDQSCESSLGQLFSYENLPQYTDPSHLAIETQPWDLASRLLSTYDSSRYVTDRDRLLELQREADSEGKTFAFQKDNVYIYCAPCLCQIWTAFRICIGAKGPADSLFQLCVRIDDRLRATCCQVSSGAAGLAAVVDQIRSIEMDSKTMYPSFLGKNIKYIDRDWIDQRLYDQEDEVFQIPAVGGARSLSFIFDRLPTKDLAALIVLGERDHLVPMLQYSPFQRSERILRENQFFNVKREEIDGERRWSLKYLGSFTAKRSLSAQATNSSSSHPQGQHYLHETSMTAAASNSRSREASPSTNASVKRRRTETTSDD